MDVGPVDLVIFEFPGNRFNGDVLPALRDLVSQEAVRILDLLFVTKDADGEVSSLDAPALALEPGVDLGELGGILGGEVLDAEDALEIGASLAPSTSAAMIVFENTWAARFASAVSASGGRVVDSARIPAPVVRSMMASA